MPIGLGSLGPIGREGLLEPFYIEAARVPDQAKICFPMEIHTHQQYELLMSMIPMGVAQQFSPGNEPLDDQPQFLQIGRFTPVMVGKQWSFSDQIEYVDQYNKIKTLQAQCAKAFAHTRNYAAAALDTTGFSTTTTYGPIAGEPLYTTAHAAGVGTGSNQPSPDIAFGPLGVMQARKEIRSQLDARGNPLLITGDIVVKVPALQWQFTEIIGKTAYMPGTNFNDINQARSGVRYETIDYYSQTSTQWFVRTDGDPFDGPRAGCLNQMPYTVRALAQQLNTYWPWLAYESYVYFWMAWQGLWGTKGL